MCAVSYTGSASSEAERGHAVHCSATVAHALKCHEGMDVRNVGPQLASSVLNTGLVVSHPG